MDKCLMNIARKMVIPKISHFHSKKKKILTQISNTSKQKIKNKKSTTQYSRHKKESHVHSNFHLKYHESKATDNPLSIKSFKFDTHKGTQTLTLS